MSISHVYPIISAHQSGVSPWVFFCAVLPPRSSAWGCDGDMEPCCPACVLPLSQGSWAAGSLGPEMTVNLDEEDQDAHINAQEYFGDAFHGRSLTFPGNIPPLDPLSHPHVADSQRSLPLQLGTVPAPPDPASPWGSSGSLGLSLRVRPFSGSSPRFQSSSQRSKATEFAPAGAEPAVAGLGGERWTRWVFIMQQ